MESQAEIFTNAELNPTKEHFQSQFLLRAGLLDEGETFEVITSWRLVDPDGTVGMEIFFAQLPDHSYAHIPLTYRPEPLDPHYDDVLLGTMQHSELGKRWVYDAHHDPVFKRELFRTIGDGRPAASNKNMDTGEVTPPEVHINATVRR